MFCFPLLPQSHIHPISIHIPVFLAAYSWVAGTPARWIGIHLTRLMTRSVQGNSSQAVEHQSATGRGNCSLSIHCKKSKCHLWGVISYIYIIYYILYTIIYNTFSIAIQSDVENPCNPDFPDMLWHATMWPLQQPGTKTPPDRWQISSTQEGWMAKPAPLASNFHIFHKKKAKFTTKSNHIFSTKKTTLFRWFQSHFLPQKNYFPMISSNFYNHATKITIYPWKPTKKNIIIPSAWWLNNHLETFEFVSWDDFSIPIDRKS